MKTFAPMLPDYKHILPVEFHIKNDIRELTRFTDDVYNLAVVPTRPDFARIQSIAYAMEQNSPGTGIAPGELFALAVLDQIYCSIVQEYRARIQPSVLHDAREAIATKLSPVASLNLLRDFSTQFSPLEVLNGSKSVDQYLQKKTAPDILRGNGDIDALVRLMLVYADNKNPACTTLRTLFDDRVLPNPELYQSAVSELRDFFRTQPDVGTGGISLFDLLELPGKIAPTSLVDQISLIQQDWADWLPAEISTTLMIARDLIREDQKRGSADFRSAKGDTPVPDFQAQIAELRRTMFAAERDSLRHLESESAQFSTDTDWMPRAVVLAKSVYVWLDQLSKKYRHPIQRLDQIPDDELAQLAQWGFNGLWLIGLWQRSPASKTIKNLRGNPDAVASAYSIDDYEINEDLGGEHALQNLRSRSQQYGIRLASDLVPNHMGIDSRWLREHPDRFIQSDTPPYPAYRFTGPNLARDERHDIRIEDGYWDQSDAAVVFQFHDRHTQRTRYIYHGNDGTSFPWNDTAQLDFLNPETREAVIQLIVNVAKKFPILRFDAAMTLTKKHFQRLWFPEPGSGGSIPSRTLFGLTRSQFDRLMTTEFWRDVVDRIAAEAPSTLLIAEAFWLTEGFFVRTLGMHRVYNSAFMNMLKHEENGKYRQVIRNTVEFDPRILQRYVNFMNNPDEDTAVAQFGKGDKYFGVAVMMATLPGLPMFGHGQIEGYIEKYGHEYQRAYIPETPDDDLVRRHEREIFPLLRQRDIFAGAEQFMLYDLVRSDGSVDDDVFIYSNRSGERSALVLFLNRYATADGTIEPASLLTQRLGLRSENGLFYSALDHISGLNYLYRSQDIANSGIHINLHAYECRVLMDFRELNDDKEQRLEQLCRHLNGRGVRNLEREFLRMFMAPLIRAFEQLCAPELLLAASSDELSADPLVELVRERAQPLTQEMSRFSNATVTAEAEQILLKRAELLRLPEQAEPKSSAQVHLITTWMCAEFLHDLRQNNGSTKQEDALQFDWLIRESVRDSLVKVNYSYEQADRLAQLCTLLIHHSKSLNSEAAIRRFSRYSDALMDPKVQDFIDCHRSGGVVWFRKELHNELVNGLADIQKFEQSRLYEKSERDTQRISIERAVAELEDIAAIAEYDFGRFITLLSYAGSRKSRPIPAAKITTAV